MNKTVQRGKPGAASAPKSNHPYDHTGRSTKKAAASNWPYTKKVNK